jgi:hypothetical protein
MTQKEHLCPYRLPKEGIMERWNNGSVMLDHQGHFDI